MQTQRIANNNTTVVHTDDETIVILHKTQIVTINKKGKFIILNTGGWNTVTTRARMNQVANEYDLGYTVSCNKGELSVLHRGQEHKFNVTITLLM